MTIDLEAIRERCEALDERMGKGPWTLERSIPYVGLFSVYDSNGNVISHGIEEQQAFIAHSRADVPALVAEVERLRASLEEILDEATSDLDRDIIITECQSALAEEETGRVTIETYPEMNAKIATMLRYNDDPMLHYAAQRIEELEAEVERLQRELHDEQVQHIKWHRICVEMGLVEPEPDALPCGHPREEEANDN